MAIAESSKSGLSYIYIILKPLYEINATARPSTVMIDDWVVSHNFTELHQRSQDSYLPFRSHLPTAPSFISCLKAHKDVGYSTAAEPLISV